MALASNSRTLVQEAPPNLLRPSDRVSRLESLPNGRSYFSQRYFRETIVASLSGMFQKGVPPPGYPPFARTPGINTLRSFSAKVLILDNLHGKYSGIRS